MKSPVCLYKILVSSWLALILLTDHVEASCVAVKMHILWRDLHVVVAVDAVRSSKEAEQERIWVQLLYHVEETHDNVVTTSSLST